MRVVVEASTKMRENREGVMDNYQHVCVWSGLQTKRTCVKCRLDSFGADAICV